jgi:serine/threonine-protein kinase
MASLDPFFGQIAIQKQLINLEQLDECLRLQKRTYPPRRIGEILVEKKYLKLENVEEILVVQEKQKGKEDSVLVDDESLEKNVIAKGYVSQRQVKDAKKVQETLHQQGKELSLGEVLISRRLITLTQLKRLRAEGEIEEGGEEKFPEIEGYAIEKKIRKGGMGTVYMSRQISMDRIVALKVLAPELADDKTYVERFVTEAKAVAQLNHENIVAGIDAGQSKGYYFFAMEFINGETILEVMRREKTLSVPFALMVTYQTTKALEHAAKHNIIHRDIKPGNIMMNQLGVIKLCDLGFAKVSNIDLLTKKGTTLGTPYYMSPEQCRGLDDIDTRSDIYSLGATLYHVLIGRVPFTGKTASEILKKHLVEDLVIPQEYRAAMGEQVCHIIERMMAKNREDRYETPRALLDELEAVMARFQAPKILIVYPTGCFAANDIALLIAEGAYIEGIKVELVKGEDVTADQLIQAGAITIGSSTASSNLSSDIRGALEIMTRFPNDMRSKLGAAFVAHTPPNKPIVGSQQLHTILQVMMDLGMLVKANFDGVLAGQKILDDPESEEAEKCRRLGHELALTILHITAGKQTINRASMKATS